MTRPRVGAWDDGGDKKGIHRLLRSYLLNRNLFIKKNGLHIMQTGENVRKNLMYWF